MNLSTFYLLKQDLVESLGGGVYERIGAADSKGVEIDFQAAPVNGMHMNAGYAYTDAQYTVKCNMCSAETAYRLIVLVLAACGGAASEAAQPEPAVLSAPAAAESTAEAATDAAESLKTEYPLTIDNCGLTYTYDAPPERGITMNQASTEVMLVLGLADKMVGTAYMDDEILPSLAEEYPSQEILFAGACCGTPNEIIRQVGAENIFADAEGNWATVSWEEVVDRDPEAIVIIEADRSTADEKIELLTTNPAYADITAVQNKRFIIVPFSATTLGIRNVAAVEDVAKGLYPDKFE
ncbi:MAG: ABC transporter substrate-binding protein [Gemmatimonadetes bacterium]|nr:ABC transporter substrate-binding protein [Gemmatimonadota bacterium]MYB70910.1 ABC transporter substrate-binding protein [Gemmatimonadota bacterium]